MTQTPQNSVPTQEAADVKSPFSVPKKKSKWPRRILILAIAAALVLFFVFQGAGGRQAVPAGTYLTDTAAVRALTVEVTGPGTVKTEDSALITASVRGDILTSPFEEGDVVQKGDVLYTIDPSDLDASIQQAETTAEQAALSVRSAQLNYDNLLKTQRDNEKNLQVKATGTGQIVKLYVEQGDTVTAGTLVAEISDRTHMRLTLPFHAADAALLSVGQAAAVQVGSETLAATVDEIAVADQPGVGGTLVRQVTLLVPNPGALSPSTSATAAVGSISCAGAGTFQYAESCQLVARYSGELETLSVQEGDWVTKDQVIGRFEATDMQAQIDSAAITLENANLSLQTARDNLRRVMDNLEDYTITAPISGRIIEKTLDAGDTLDQTTLSAGPMMILYDMSRFTFQLNVDELDISRVRVGQKVVATVSALDDKSFEGTVDKVSINGVTVSGKTTYPVTVVLTGSGEDLAAQGLYPGMNVSASIVVEEIGQVLSIPVEYVDRGNTVLVAGEGCLDEEGNVTDLSLIETRTVTVGRGNEEYVEILSGLNEGDVVLRQNTHSSLMGLMSRMGG